MINIKFLSSKILFINIILLFIFKPNIYADNDPYGARQIAMGNSSVMLGGLWSISHNQAGLSEVEKLSMGMYYESKFQLNKLSYKAFCLALPVSGGVFGVDISHYGYSSFNNIKADAVFSRKLGKKISAGILIGYSNINLGDDYGNKGTFYAEAGIQAQPIEKLSIGAHIYNPTMSSIPFGNEYQLPTILSLGAGYNFGNKFLLTAEYSNSFDEDEQFKSGIEFNAYNNLWLRGGVNITTANYYFGVGYLLKPINIDIAFSNHIVLGYSAHVSISYILNK